MDRATTYFGGGNNWILRKPCWYVPAFIEPETGLTGNGCARCDLQRIDVAGQSDQRAAAIKHPLSPSVMRGPPPPSCCLRPSGSSTTWCKDRGPAAAILWRAARAAAMVAGPTLTPNSSTGTCGSCASCEAGWAGSSATSVAISKASHHRRRHSLSPLAGPRRSAGRSASVSIRRGPQAG